MARYDIVTFDCYGTLIDWESGIFEAFRSAAAEEGVVLARKPLFEAWGAIEPVVEGESYRLYREVLAETAVRVAARLGWTLGRDRAGFVAASLPDWRPFPDTNGALEALVAAGCRLGILSNVDRDLLAATVRHFTVRFDLIITAEDVQSYKPAAGHFLEARRMTAGASWLHAAQSNFHDIVPANALGIPTAWINRGGETPLPEGIPLHEFTDLARFANWMRS